MSDIGVPLLSRMEVSAIEAPDKWAAIDLVAAISSSVLRRLRLDDTFTFDRRALYLLAHLSPWRMKQATEQAVAAAVAAQRRRIGEYDLWREVEGVDARSLH